MVTGSVMHIFLQLLGKSSSSECPWAGVVLLLSIPTGAVPGAASPRAIKEVLSRLENPKPVRILCTPFWGEGAVRAVVSYWAIVRDCVCKPRMLHFKSSNYVCVCTGMVSRRDLRDGSDFCVVIPIVHASLTRGGEKIALHGKSVSRTLICDSMDLLIFCYRC